MRASESIATARLLLRRPAEADAASILSYAGDPEVTRWLEWPRHCSLEDSLAFVSWADVAWSSTPAGPYVITHPEGEVIGSTGLTVETPFRALTGYVLARHAWGRGYATEVTAAMAEVAASLGIVRLAALCHPDNRASTHVLHKAGFTAECVLRHHTVFPNLESDQPLDVEIWARILTGG